MPKQAILIVARETTFRQRLKTLLQPYIQNVIEAVEPTGAILAF